MPRIYRDKDRPSSGTACTLWRNAADHLAELYIATHELSTCLDAKAGHVASEGERPEQEIDPEVVTADTVLEFDGDSKTLGDWCRMYDTPIELSQKRVADGMSWEEAVVLGPESFEPPAPE